MTNGKITIFGSVIITAMLFWFSKRVNPAADLWQLFAQITGIYGLLLLAWSYILAIRHPLLEQMFGSLDKVYRTHHIMGGISFLLLVHHPVLLVLRQLPNNTIPLYFIPTGTFSYALGIIALYTLFVLLILTLYVDLPYKLWKQTHEWMGLVIVLGAWHGLLVSSDMSRFMPLTAWLSIWSVLAISAFIYKRFLYDLLNPGEIYDMKNVVWDKDVVIVTLQNQKPTEYQTFSPGQFGFLSFYEHGKRRDEHPFSVIAQEGNCVRFGIKVTGGFTLKLAQSVPGTPIRIRGPFGSFGTNKKSALQNIWIAGGIGITPFLHLLHSIRETDRVTFIFTVRGAHNGVLMQMVSDLLPHKPSVRFIIHDSKTSGRLTAKKIAEYTDIPKESKVWLCGPQPLMLSLSEQFPSFGIRRSHIYFEDFALR